MTEEQKLAFLDKMVRNGVNIGQLIMDNHGTMEISNNMGGSGEERKPKVTEEHIARALIALNGKGKPIDSQRAWLGACCLLGWKYGFPRNLKDCCQQLEGLVDMGEVEFECKYDSIRMYGSWKFVKEKYDDWEDYTPRDDERAMFEKSLSVAQSLEKEILKQAELEV